MKYFASGIAAAALAAIVFTTPAQAATYNIVFNSDNFDVNALISTNAFDVVTGISGIVAGSQGAGSINNFVVVGDPNPIFASWTWDNVFTGTPAHVTNGGVLFQTISGVVFNLYLSGTAFILSVGNPNEAFYNPGEEGTLAVSEVPLPAALPLLAAALGGLGFLGRSRKRRYAQSAAA